MKNMNDKPVHKIDNVNNTLDDNIAISLEKQNIKRSQLTKCHMYYKLQNEYIRIGMNILN